jgi:hypothetical protein
MSKRFKDPGIPDGEKTTYEVSISRRRVGDATSLIEHVDDSSYRHVLESDLSELQMTVEQVFLREDGEIAAATYRAESRADGRVVSTETADFRDTRHLQFGGKVESFPANLTPLLGSMISLRGLDFRKGSQATFSLWLGFSVFWPIHVKVERREQVAVPAGTFDSWSVKLRPSFAEISGVLDKVIGGLLPAFVLHFAAEHPHQMLRFEFPTGPFRWNPKGLVEASSVG